jgi:hypothetical protein
MGALAIPLIFLYFAAGLMALLIDKRRGKRSAIEDEKFDPSASPID